MRQLLIDLENWMDDQSGFLSLAKYFLVFTPLLALIVGVVFVGVSYLYPADPHIVLNKSEWHCSHSQTVMVPMLVGKLVVTMPQEVCDQYERISR